MNSTNFNITSIEQNTILIRNLINRELEYLGLSKKYIGFKYIVDYVIQSLNNKHLNHIKIFNIIASQNNTTFDTVEHAIKNILITSVKTNIIFKNNLNLINNQIISYFEILSNLLIYFEKML